MATKLVVWHRSRAPIPELVEIVLSNSDFPCRIDVAVAHLGDEAAAVDRVQDHVAHIV